MKVNKLCYWIFSLLLSVKSMVSSICTCDLLANACDINCCCDPDCSAKDRNIFSTCINVDTKVEEVCVSDSLLYSADGRYQIEGSGGGLLCLYKDNYNARFFYSEVLEVNDHAAFEGLASRYRKTSYDFDSEVKKNYENSFKVGDPMFVLFAGDRQGFLPQPASFLTNKCEDNNPARFLRSEKSNCFRIVENLEKQCGTELSWNAQSYVKGYKVAPYPSFIFRKERFIETSNSSQTNETVEVIPGALNDSLLISPHLASLQCKDAKGVVKSCSFAEAPSPNFKDNKCSNVVMEVKYAIMYTNDAAVELYQVNVSLILGDVMTTFQQTNQFSFSSVVNSSASNATNNTIYRRSGNPGYLVGLPVISGNVDNNEDTISIDPSYLNSSVHFSTIQTSVQGSCTVGNNKMPILFGIDIRTGCFVTLKNVMSLLECEQVQNNIFSILLQDLPTHVAKFGNSDRNISQWIAVINDLPTGKPAVSNGQCFNMFTSAVFEFLFAKTGFLSNPQNKIVGVQVRYQNARNLVSQCHGLFCSSSETFKVEITQAVSFIDVSTTPQVKIKSKPEFKSKAPNDFLYPFL